MRSIGFAALLGFTGTIAALPGEAMERQVCHISTKLLIIYHQAHATAINLPQVITSTVTADAHPMTFWPLAPLASTATPLSYGSPPTASKVPTGPRKEANPDPDCTSDTIPTPTTTGQPWSSSSLTRSSSAASTTICTVIRGRYPASTLPGFCRPTLFTNAPSLAQQQPTGQQSFPPLPTAIVTMGANSVPDKVNCCAECAAYYNCFAWRFVPSYVGAPSDRLPAGFDPWRHGNCEIAYYTGDGTGVGAENVTREDAPSVCPNGRLRGTVRGSENPRLGSWFDGLYYNGWNQGACGEVGAELFLGGGDLGVGDESSLCDA